MPELFPALIMLPRLWSLFNLLSSFFFWLLEEDEEEDEDEEEEDDLLNWFSSLMGIWLCSLKRGSFLSMRGTSFVCFLVFLLLLQQPNMSLDCLLVINEIKTMRKCFFQPPNIN